VNCADVVFHQGEIFDVTAPSRVENRGLAPGCYQLIGTNWPTDRARS
jgi:hypothetical protein